MHTGLRLRRLEVTDWSQLWGLCLETEVTATPGEASAGRGLPDGNPGITGPQLLWLPQSGDPTSIRECSHLRAPTAAQGNVLRKIMDGVLILNPVSL